ncbi:nucleoid-associated protein [Roseomonas sp. USHLN139]|uniref:nucleoid-associated protein n=1 Tax=Roseomonas sp. USHLN139 TaxID=3081298 RepID=UPI003B021252
MQFENLLVRRIAMHEIFKRDDDKSIKPPVLAQRLETLSAEAMGAFRLRMTEALSGQSQSLQMRIIHHGPGTFLDLAESLLGSDDASYLEGSKAFANKLAANQMARRIPGGILLVFDGTVGARSVPFLGVIKAETQAGFRRSATGPDAVVEFIQNIFLTPATRLYKIGIVAFDDLGKPKPEGRHAFVFDSNISVSNREAAASYFYEAFLGCAMPSDGPYETARFFDLTKGFVRKSALDADKKRELIDSLYVFVRDEQAPTFTADQFSTRYLPQDMQDGFAAFLDTKKFTTGAVVRDTSGMGSRLRRRRLKFGTDIELSASPEALKDKIKIEAIKADGEDHLRWTRITIQDVMTGEQ